MARGRAHLAQLWRPETKSAESRRNFISTTWPAPNAGPEPIKVKSFLEHKTFPLCSEPKKINLAFWYCSPGTAGGRDAELKESNGRKNNAVKVYCAPHSGSFGRDEVSLVHIFPANETSSALWLYLRWSTIKQWKRKKAGKKFGTFFCSLCVPNILHDTWHTPLNGIH